MSLTILQYEYLYVCINLYSIIYTTISIYIFCNHMISLLPIESWCVLLEVGQRKKKSQWWGHSVSRHWNWYSLHCYRAANASQICNKWGATHTKQILTLMPCQRVLVQGTSCFFAFTSKVNAFSCARASSIAAACVETAGPRSLADSTNVTHTKRICPVSFNVKQPWLKTTWLNLEPMRWSRKKPFSIR